ncbi:MAG: YaeQ family protein [Fluviibacter sp.]
MRYKNLSVIQISPEDSAKLVEAAGRTMKLSWTIQEGMVYLDNASITPVVLLSAQS